MRRPPPLIGPIDRPILPKQNAEVRQAGHLDPSAETPFGKLLAAPNVIIKQKRLGTPMMHLKSYCVDGRTFRTGSANFSASALRQQDNDLLLFDDPHMCADFTIEFDEIWEGKDAE